MKLDNYLYTDVDGKPIVFNTQKRWKIFPRKSRIRLCGEVYDRPGTKDGQYILTTLVRKLTNNQIRTDSGSVYELQTMNPDYKEMIHVIELGIPVITHWNIEKNSNTFTLWGKDLDDEFVSGTVISQNGNFVTLVDNETPGIKKDFFVCWRSFSLRAETGLKLCGSLAGLNYEEFEDAFLMKCRPRLFS